MRARDEERDRLAAWQEYTANALWSIATTMGASFGLYSDLVHPERKAKPAKPEAQTGREIADALLAQMEGLT